MRQLFIELSKAGGETAGIFEKMAGQSFQEFVARGGNVQDALLMMEQAADQSGVGIQDLFGSVEAGNAALALTGSGSSAFTAALAEMDAATGATATAYGTMDEGLSRNVDRLKAFGSTSLITIGEALSPLLGAVLNVAEGALPKLGAILTDVIVPAIGKGIDILKQMKAAWDNDWNGIRTNVMTAIATVRTTIATALANIQNYWTQHGGAIMAAVGSAYQTVSGIIKLYFTTIFTIAKSVFAELQKFWATHGQSIMTAAQSAYTTVRNVIVSALAGIQNFWTQHGGAIMAAAGKIWDFIKNVIVVSVTNAVAIVKSVITTLQNFWAAHGETIMTVASVVWNAIKTTIETVIGVITQVWSAFQAAREGDWTAFGEHLRNAWDLIWGAVLRVAELAWEGIKKALGNAIEWVKDIITETDWLQLGKDIALGIARGLGAAASAIANAALSAARAALDAAKGFLGISSPSSVAAAQIGAPFAQGIGLGATEEMASVGGQINRALQSDLLRSPALPGAAANRQQIVQHTHTYNVTINDTRAMAVFLDYLQSIEGRIALEAI
jgi:phage-related protein